MHCDQATPQRIDSILMQALNSKLSRFNDYAMIKEVTLVFSRLCLHLFTMSGFVLK